MTPKTATTSVCKICKICYDASDGFHFGTLACRACAAFFRRSTVAKRHYICRYSGKCKIEKAARSMCRACRLKKCLALGMKPEHVQDQRGRIRNVQCSDAKGFTEEEQKAVTSVEVEQSSPKLEKEHSQHQKRASVLTNETESDSLPEIKSQCNAVPVIQNFRRYDEAPAIQIIDEATITLPDNVPTLKKLYSDYRQYKKFRKIATNVFNYYGRSNNTKLLRELTLDEAKRLIRADVSVISVFINECLPGFKGLPENEKIVLFKTFLKNFLIIDESFWTAKYFSAPDDDRCVIPFSGYIKLNMLADLFVCDGDSNRFENSKIIKSLFERYRKLLRDSIVELNMTEPELLAVLSISLWDNGNESLSALTKLHAQDSRNILLKELYNYCSFIDHETAPARYGTLLEYLKIVELLMHEMDKNGIVFKILDIAIGETTEETTDATKSD